MGEREKDEGEGKVMKKKRDMEGGGKKGDNEGDRRRKGDKQVIE